MMHTATVGTSASAPTREGTLALVLGAAARWVASSAAAREQRARAYVRARLARQSTATLQDLGFGRIEIEAIRREAAKGTPSV